MITCLEKWPAYFVVFAYPCYCFTTLKATWVFLLSSIILSIIVTNTVIYMWIKILLLRIWYIIILFKQLFHCNNLAFNISIVFILILFPNKYSLYPGDHSEQASRQTITPSAIHSSINHIQGWAKKSMVAYLALHPYGYLQQHLYTAIHVSRSLCLLQAVWSKPWPDDVYTVSCICVRVCL